MCCCEEHRSGSENVTEVGRKPCYFQIANQVDQDYGLPGIAQRPRELPVPGPWCTREHGPRGWASVTDCLQHVSLCCRNIGGRQSDSSSVCVRAIWCWRGQCHTSFSSISQNYRVCYFLIEGSGRRVWPAQLSEMALVFLLKACEPTCTNVSVAKSFLLF